MPHHDQVLKLYANNKEACVSLGAIYFNGLAGLSNRDLNKAFYFYNIAAELGSKEAWYNLYHMYSKGQGVSKSEEMAAHINKTIFEDKL